jgi:predicted dehydrogenase
VLLEKPMVTRTDHARALAEKVRQTGKVLVVCYNTSFTAPFVHLREAVRNGTYGRLEMVHGYLSQNWKKLTAGTWRHDPAQSGGGQAYDSGAHLLNSLCWTVESPVAEVFAILDNQDDTVDINASIAARFGNGVMATIAVSGNCPSDGTHAVFVFDGGRVEIDGWGGKWIRVYDGDGEVEEVALPGAPASANDNFVDAIAGRAEPLVTVDNGIIQCELMDAVYESARTGQAVRVQR